MRRSALALALLTLPVPAARAGLLEDALAGKAAVVDLSWELARDIPVFPGGVPFQIASLAKVDRDGWEANLLVLGEHTGTHLDAPAHFAAGQAHAHEIPPAKLVAEAAVIDVSARAAAAPDYRLSLEDVSAWELTHGPVPEGAVVFLRSGWGRRWPSPAAYLHRDKAGVMRFPGFSLEAARHLIEQRGARGLGTDTLSIDHGPTRDFPVHKFAMARGRFALENVANLEQLPAKGAVVVIAALNVHDGSGGPARILAFVPEGAEPALVHPGAP